MARFHFLSRSSFLLVSLLFSAFHTMAQAPASTSIDLEATATAPGQPLVHFWSKIAGAGRANEGLRATWQEELATAHRYGGFQYIRFHGLFHDDMFVYREDEHGQPVYNFQYIDDLFDRMLAQGVRPFVELGFSPSEMATTKSTVFWWHANGSPPTDNAKWAALVRATVEHWIARYGQDEVRQWYFEVWNEPNLTKPFFRGTQQQYFELYRVTAQTIKAVDPALRVGGPATSNFDIDHEALKQAQASGAPFDPLSIPWKPIWIEDFLAYCHANQLPVDFVSTHPYPADFAIDTPGSDHVEHFRRSVNATRDDLRLMRKIVDASPYPHAGIELTEWNTSPSVRDHSHDGLAAAAMIVKANLDSIGLVDSLSYWTFTDVFEEVRKTDSIFHSSFGLINYQQIVKPAFHAYRCMNALGDELLARTDGAIITRNKATGRLIALAYNYPPEMKVSLPVSETLAESDAVDASGSPRGLSLELHGLKPGAIFLIETLDRQHGNAILDWEKMGKPEPPTRAQTESLRTASWATAKELIQADAHGNLVLHRSIAPWDLLLLQQL